MLRFFIGLCCCSLFHRLDAQIAFVRDSDGFSNVRDSASLQAKVLHTLWNDAFVFVLEDDTKGEWLLIDYQKNGNTFSGYIHQSRVQLLTRLTKFETAELTEGVLKLRLDSIQIRITERKFVVGKRRLVYDKPQGEQQFLKSIDGKSPWGTDGGLPRMEYNAIQIRTGSRSLTFPAAMVNDLFEPNLHMTAIYLDKKTKKIFIEAMNGDGAGAYVVVWAVKNGSVVDRQVFIPF